jgi:ABC-type glycerol-3-phosphate transport system permease component
MEAVMDGIGKQAAFYRAYLPHDRSLLPTAVALCAVITIWLFIYLVSVVGPQQEQRTADAGVRAAAALVSRPVSH